MVCFNECASLWPVMTLPTAEGVASPSSNLAGEGCCSRRSLARDLHPAGVVEAQDAPSEAKRQVCSTWGTMACGIGSGSTSQLQRRLALLEIATAQTDSIVVIQR